MAEWRYRVRCAGDEVVLERHDAFEVVVCFSRFQPNKYVSKQL